MKNFESYVQTIVTAVLVGLLYWAGAALQQVTLSNVQVKIELEALQLAVLEIRASFISRYEDVWMSHEEDQEKSTATTVDHEIRLQRLEYTKKE